MLLLMNQNMDWHHFHHIHTAHVLGIILWDTLRVWKDLLWRILSRRSVEVENTLFQRL